MKKQIHGASDPGIKYEFPIKRDLLFIVVSSAFSFSIVYGRALYHEPENLVANFLWPILSFSFLIHAVFICLVFPLLYMFHTFSGYFVRESIAKVLRVTTKYMLSLCSFVLLNGQVAYIGIENDQTVLVLSNGDRVACAWSDIEDSTVKRSQRNIVSHVFDVGGDYYYTLGYFRSELPPIKHSLSVPPIKRGSEAGKAGGRDGEDVS